jgi:YVTN family beta-propeller protein
MALLALLLLLAQAAAAAEYAAPAGSRPAVLRPGSPSILPGGRILAPHGQEIKTGPGPFGIAISKSGRRIVSANSGPERFSLTVAERNKNSQYEVRHVAAERRKKEDGKEPEKEDDEWRSVFMGLAFAGEKEFYASEGNSGRVSLMDFSDGHRKKQLSADTGGFEDSYTGDLAFDPERGLLYVVDQANFRLVIFDTRKGAVLSSLKLGRLPFALSLSPDRRRAWITNIGMFEYKALPGADRHSARETGLPFPAFGFPSPESRDGARRETSRGPVEVPALGDPNVQESNSVCAVNLDDPAKPKLEAFIRTGRPFGDGVHGGSSPSGVLATAGRVYVSNAHNDSITVIDPKTMAAVAEIPLRIPGLETLRGMLPLGLAYHEGTKWLFVAEAGINAVGVIDTEKEQAIAHIPAGWFPTRVLVDRDNVYVANAKGRGTGPNVSIAFDESFVGVLRRGSVSVFPVPAKTELPELTGRTFAANGFFPQKTPAAALPSAIRYVVLIVKENRTYDEVFGDLCVAANGQTMCAPPLARFGKKGYIDGRGRRLSLQGFNVLPNHRRLAELYSFGDNFYADSDVSVDGHHWLAGSYPNAWTESTLMASYAGEKNFRFPTNAPGRLLFAESASSVHPEEQLEAGTLWHHLERHGIPFRNFGEGFELAGLDEGAGLQPTGARFLTNVPMPDPLFRNTSRQYPGFNMNIPDQFRAAQFIREMETDFKGKEFPRFVFIHLPNDHMAKPRPLDGYPYAESYVADNDYALGRIVEYLSRTPWWKQMAVFITEDDAQGGRDHIDAHRTVLLGVGPYFKRNHATHVNSSFGGLLKTIFRLLGIPGLNLFDATASDLSDMFSSQPNFEPYELQPVDARLFDPAKAREPLDPEPSPRMDDPRFLREQRR